MTNRRLEPQEPALTRRERDVVRLVAGGLSNRSVAHHLGLREGTVKIHLHNIYRKLRIQNRMALVLMNVSARRRRSRFAFDRSI
jgi:two-component system nitrate/nitrite response regulator NarL